MVPVAQILQKRCDIDVWTELTIMLSCVLETIAKQSPTQAGWSSPNVEENFASQQWQKLLTGRLALQSEDLVPVAEYLETIA